MFHSVVQLNATCSLLFVKCHLAWPLSAVGPLNGRRLVDVESELDASEVRFVTLTSSLLVKQYNVQFSLHSFAFRLMNFAMMCQVSFCLAVIESFIVVRN
jgi:hypothetical protein